MDNQNAILVIDKNLHMSPQSFEDIHKWLGNDVEKGTFYIPNVGMIQYSCNPNNPKYTRPNKTSIHPILRSITFPLVLSLKGNWDNYEMIDEPLSFTIANYLSISYKTSFPIGAMNLPFKENRMELQKCENQEEGLVLKNTFIGKDDAVLGAADITVVDSPYSSNEEPREDGWLDMFNVFVDKVQYLQNLYNFEANQSPYDMEKSSVWGRIGIIHKLYIFPIYSKEVIQTSIYEMLSDLINRLQIDCLLVKLEDLDIYLDHQTQIKDYLLLTTKERILNSLGFISSSGYMLFQNLTEVEKDHFHSIQPKHFFTSLYGTTEEYKLEGKAAIRRIMMKYNNTGGNRYNLQQSLNMAAYHGDVDTVNLLIEKGFSPHIRDSLDFTVFQLSVIHDFVDVLAYLFENGFVPEDEIIPLAEFAIESNAVQILRYLLESHIDSASSIEHLLKAAIDEIQGDCIKLMLEHGADLTTPDGSLYAYATYNESPTELLALLNDYDKSQMTLVSQ